MLHDDVTPYAVGTILCAIGLVAIALFLSQRTDPSYAHYGGFAFSMGLWLICQTGSRNYLIDAPMAWLTVEIHALYCAVACLVRYVHLIFGRGPLGLTRVLADAFLAFVVLSALALAFGWVQLITPLLPFRILLLIGIVYMLGLMAALSWQGHTEARLFAAGFLVSALFGVHDTLALYGLLPRSDISLSQFGQGGFVLFLGLILARRFSRVYRTLARAEKTLSEKVAQLEDRNREVQQLNDDLRRQIVGDEVTFARGLDGERAHALLAEGDGAGGFGAGGGFGDAFLERVPGATLGTLAEPLRGRAAARGADPATLGLGGLGHGRETLRRHRGAGHGIDEWCREGVAIQEHFAVAQPLHTPGFELSVLEPCNRLELRPRIVEDFG